MLLVDKDLVEKDPGLLSLPGMPIGDFGNGVGNDLQAADGLGREFYAVIGKVGRHGFPSYDGVRLSGRKGPEPLEVLFIRSAPDF